MYMKSSKQKYIHKYIMCIYIQPLFTLKKMTENSDPHNIHNKQVQMKNIKIYIFSSKLPRRSTRSAGVG